MIEVLVSLAVVAFGLLGLAGLQARSMSFQKDSFDRKAAAELAAQITERVKANYDGFRAGDYDQKLELADTPSGTVPACGDAANCTAAEVAARDWAMLQLEVRRRLPESAIYMTAPADSLQMTVVLAWQEGLADPSQAVDPNCAGVVGTDNSYRCLSWMVHP